MDIPQHQAHTAPSKRCNLCCRPPTHLKTYGSSCTQSAINCTISRFWTCLTGSTSSRSLARSTVRHCQHSRRDSRLVHSDSDCKGEWQRKSKLRTAKASSATLYLILMLEILQLTIPCLAAKTGLCADPEPTDILALAVSDTQSYTDGVELVNIDGVQGYRFGPTAFLAGVDSDDIFIHCDRFPVEFSVVVNFNHKLVSTTNEFVLTLMAQDKRTIFVALRIRSKRFYFDYMSQGELRTVNVKDDRFIDGNWHTVVVTVSRRMAKFTIDCAAPVQRELVVPFPKRMNIQNTRIYVASRRKKTKQFTGLLRQLILFSGSDATARICPSTNPPFGSPGTSAGQGVLFESDKQKVDCSLDQRGTLMYKDDRSLEVCTGTTFQQVRGGRERMDYVIDYDDINLENATVSMEWFKIEGVGLFLATAGGAGGSSQVMKWDGSRFNPFQSVPINNVMHWKFFQIGFDNYLAASVLSSNCIIFRWARRRRKFVLSQRLQVVNARNSEFFSQKDRHFLAVADYGQESGLISTPHSVIFEFREGRFEVFQYLETTGAVDVTFFSVEDSVFCLAIASAFHQNSFVVTSSIFCAFPPITEFLNYQDIVTYGATDWEFFKINGRYFLVVANGVNSTRPILQGESVNSTDSVIYELNLIRRQFHTYQKISTQNAYDWEFFTIGAQYFLAVTSTFAIDGGTPNVKIYRWKGYEKFVLEHTLPFGTALDIDYIPINGDHYLAVANPKTSASTGYHGNDHLGSKLYKIVTY